MSDQNFTEEELQEAQFLEDAEQETHKPVKKQSVVKTYINPVKFKEDIAINILDLDNAFVNQAALAAYYGIQCAKANEQVDNLKLVMDVREAQIGHEIRRALIDEGTKPTEALINAGVMVNKQYIKARRAHNEARTNLEMLKAAVEAFRQRRDMLSQLGNNERQEKRGELFIRDFAGQSDRQERANKRVARGN